VWGLRISLLSAGGNAPESFNREQRGSFVDMADELLKLVGAPSNASAVDLFNQLHQTAGKASATQEKILRLLRMGPAPQSQISDLLNRHASKWKLRRALRWSQKSHADHLVQGEDGREAAHDVGIGAPSSTGAAKKVAKPSLFTTKLSLEFPDVAPHQSNTITRH